MAANTRAVLEVFKWLDPASILQSAISRLWSKLRLSPEVWNCLLDLHFSPLDLEEASSQPHLAYQELRLRRHAATVALLWRDHCLRTYNCVSRTFESTILLDCLDEYAASGALLSPSKLFLCKGLKNDPSAVLIDLKTAHKTLFPHMQIARTEAGVVFLLYSIYVFGGFNGVSLSSAERFDLNTQNWTVLPDMLSPRSSFSVCFRGKKVYLCGGNTVNCEVFDTFAEKYTAIPIQLYAPDSTVSVLYQNDLFIVDSDSIYRYKNEHLQSFQVILQWGV